MKTLNEVYSLLSAERRYEVWFTRFGLSDNSGAWWLRYLLLSPGRHGNPENPAEMPVQVWATWFPSHRRPQTFIQGFPVGSLDLSERDKSPFHFSVAGNEIRDDSCRASLQAEGHQISWDLRYRSTFRVTLSDKGWIGFSRTPHSDAVFSGRIVFDGQVFEGEPLGFGVQGHNCGYRHRNFWTWAHACFSRGPSPSTLEALEYDMPLGLLFRKAVLWHDGREYDFRRSRKTARDRDQFRWQFQCERSDAILEVLIDGAGPSLHRLPYLKTDLSGTFDVLNNSLAYATVRIERRGGPVEMLETSNGAVLEMAGPG